MAPAVLPPVSDEEELGPLPNSSSPGAPPGPASLGRRLLLWVVVIVLLLSFTGGILLLGR